MQDKPNFWSVTPATVRYDAKLSEFSRLLYGELWALADKHGYCFSSNAYFARVFEVSESKVSRALAELTEAGYVLASDNQGGESQRKLTPQINPFDKVKNKHLSKTAEVHLGESAEHNNTSIINNTSITTNVVKDSQICLPVQGKSSLLRLVKLYSGLYRNQYGTNPTVDFGRSGKALKVLVGAHGEYKVALALLLYFGWKGANGDDEFMYKRLSGSAFPLYWLADHIDPILAYWRNVIKVDVDSPEQVKRVVDKRLGEMGLLV